MWRDRVRSKSKSGVLNSRVLTLDTLSKLITFLGIYARRAMAGISFQKFFVCRALSEHDILCK